MLLEGYYLILFGYNILIRCLIIEYVLKVTSDFKFDPVFENHKRLLSFKQVQEQLFLDDIK